VNSPPLGSTLYVWNLVRRQLVAQKPDGTTSLITQLIYRPDGKSLLAGACIVPTPTRGGQLFCQQRAILQWDASTYKPMPPILTGHYGDGDAFTDITFSRDGAKLITGELSDTGDNSLVQVNLQDPSAPHTQFPLLGAGSILSLQISPFGTQVLGLTTSPDGTEVLAETTSADGRQWGLWSLDPERQPLGQFYAAEPDLSGGISPYLSSEDGVLSPDGKTLALIDCTAGEEPPQCSPLMPAKWDTHTHQFSPGFLVPDTDLLEAISPDLKLAVLMINCSGFFGTACLPRQPGQPEIQLWDIKGQQAAGAPFRPITVMPGTNDVPADSLTQFVFSPNGNLLAITGFNNTDPNNRVKFIEIWSVKTHKLVRSIRDYGGSISFSPDSQWLAMASCPPTGTATCTPAPCALCLWSMQTGQIQTVLQARGLRDDTLGQQFVFSPNGRYIVTHYGIWDRSRRSLIRLPLAATVAVPIDPISFVVSAETFAPDNTTLALSWCSDQQFGNYTCLDPTLELWDVPSGQQLGTPLVGAVGKVGRLIFTNGGKTLIGIDAGTSPGIILWDVDRSSWQQRACELAHRQLSQVEWHQYLPWENQYGPVCTGS
jgi:WD40 repeat protein